MEDKVWRITDIIQWSTRYLKDKAVENPRLTAEILLAGTLNCRRIDLYLQFDQPLGPEERRRYREMLRQRVNGLPWQYILGKTEFFSLPFEVSSAVLIPRPETEQLVEKVLSYCARLADKNLLIWDIGTGSGAIAVALARHLPTASVTASDISSDALAVAKTNAAANLVASQIHFVQSDLEKSTDGCTFDIIVSNPPYIPTAELSHLQPEVKHEPSCALDGGPDGLAYYRRLNLIAKKHLQTSGLMALEIGADQGPQVQQILHETAVFETIEIHQDYARRDRIVLAKKRGNP